MNKQEFLHQLELNLRIGGDEMAEVMSYYSEYFEDAGPENEQAVIAELGDPVELAKKLNLEFDEDRSDKEQRAEESVDCGDGAGSTGYYDAGAKQSGSYQDFSNLGAAIGDAVRSAVEAALGVAGEAIDAARKATDEIKVEMDEKTREELSHAKEDIRQAAREMKMAGKEMAGEARQMAKDAGAVTREVYQGTKGVFTSLREILWGSSDQQEYYYYANEDMEPFNAVIVDVSNCPIRVARSLSGRFGVNVKLSVRAEDQVIVNVESGVLTIKKIRGGRRGLFGGGSGSSQYVELYLPEMEYDYLDFITSNAAVKVSDLLRVRDYINIDTSNGSIEVKGTLVDGNVKLDTSNSAINVMQVCCKALEADTSNGGITMEDVSALRATLDTSNGGIKVRNSDIAQMLNADTSNGSIEVMLLGSESDYRIHADTSNAKVYVEGRSCGSEYITRSGSKTVRLDTSNGRINIGFAQ